MLAGPVSSVRSYFLKVEKCFLSNGHKMEVKKNNLAGGLHKFIDNLIYILLKS